MGRRPISFNDFKNWMSEQKDLSDFFSIDTISVDTNIGKKAVAKASEKKILERIETESDPDVVVQDFLANGGVVQSIEEQKVWIEVNSGTFALPRFCVKIPKS